MSCGMYRNRAAITHIDLQTQCEMICGNFLSIFRYIHMHLSHCEFDMHNRFAGCFFFLSIFRSKFYLRTYSKHLQTNQRHTSFQFHTKTDRRCHSSDGWSASNGNQCARATSLYYWFFFCFCSAFSCMK